VHVPYCHTLCGYCDFYSQVLDRAATAPLVDAVCRELDTYLAGGAGLPPLKPLRVATIFVGGGTPTVLPPADLERLLARLGSLADPHTALEFTVEANPATVTPRMAEVLRAAGVNRVSIGAQSFQERDLRVLERIHRPAQVAETVAHCRAAGITNISLDLMFGIPGQSLTDWLGNLGAALDLGPQHLSCYGLTYESGTPLRARLERGELARVDEEIEAEMFEVTRERLAAAGLPAYEISNFARPGLECRHNLGYWRNEPYLGLGPSAAGFVDELRYRNIPDTAVWAGAITGGRSAWCEQERLSGAERARETAMLALRLTRGIARDAFCARFGVDPAEMFAGIVERHVAAGLLAVEPDCIRLTRAGLLVANRVMADFL
jgi:oxygen-independent coproporphyrinogen-3 oxidase